MIKIGELVTCDRCGCGKFISQEERRCIADYKKHNIYIVVVDGSRKELCESCYRKTESYFEWAEKWKEANNDRE
jgi:ribosome modulation factor